MDIIEKTANAGLTGGFALHITSASIVSIPGVLKPQDWIGVLILNVLTE